MRTLYLIRHAKSSWDTPGLRDINRPLNERGLRTAPQMAGYLQGLGISPDLVVSSPAKRALSTAQIFAGVYGIPDEAIKRNEYIYDAFPLDIMRVVSELPPEAATVFLFGHNPSITELANRFSESPIANVPTCGVVQIRSTADSWAAFYEENSRVSALFFPKEVLD